MIIQVEILFESIVRRRFELFRGMISRLKLVVGIHDASIASWRRVGIFFDSDKFLFYCFFEF